MKEGEPPSRRRRSSQHIEHRPPKLPDDPRVDRLSDFPKAWVNLGRLADHPELTPAQRERYQAIQMDWEGWMTEEQLQELERFKRDHERGIISNFVRCNGP